MPPHAPLAVVARFGQRAALAAVLALVLAPAASGWAPPVLPEGFYDEPVVTELNRPLAFEFLPDGRLLFLEQRTGRLRMVVNGRLAETDPVLTLDSVSTSGEEQGAVGLAVDPGWPNRPYVYVFHTALGGTMRLSRFTAVGDLSSPGSGLLSSSPASRFDILRDIPDVTDAHNAGCVRFGTDGLLFLSLGDDQLGCTSQDSVTLRGSILRLEVRGLPPGPGINLDLAALVAPGNPLETHPDPRARLVWAIGLRNPFRFHVDPLDNSLFLTDVGWTTWEEVDHITGPGQNLGWPYYEGPQTYVSTCPGIVPTGDVEPPIYSVYRVGTTSALMSAGVYRHPACSGCGFPAEYEGDYFFSDYYRGFLRRLRRNAGVWSVAPAVAGQPATENWGTGFEQVSDYTVGPDGALWYVRNSADYLDNTGEIHRIFHHVGTASVAIAPPGAIELGAPYPSPARNGATLPFALSRPARIRLAVYDAQGRVVRRVLDGVDRGAGPQSARWDGRFDDGRPAAPGIYEARLTAGAERSVRRIAVVR